LRTLNRSRADTTGGWRTYSDPGRAKRSFEALSPLSIALKVSRSLTNIWRNYQQSIALSQDDKLETMNSYVLNAAHQQGMNQDTVVTALMVLRIAEPLLLL